MFSIHETTGPRGLALALVLAAALGCNGDDPAEPNDNVLELSVTPAAVVVLPGAVESFLVTVVVSGDFDGTVTLTVDDLPPGVTVTEETVEGEGSVVLTLTAAADAVPGTVEVTVRATADGLGEATATLTLTVAASG